MLTLSSYIRQEITSFFGAIVFYTILPIPGSWTRFERLPRWGPAIGLLLGSLLGLLDLGLSGLSVPVLTRGALLVGVWVFLTGGLHLDGASDTADGLAVTDPSRRLSVMADSVTGAFGVMAVVMVIFLKVAALTDIEGDRFLALVMAAVWGRWGQVMAIALYPYLKPTGKGAFHKTQFQVPRDAFGGILGGLGIGFGGGTGIASIALGSAIALGTGYWLARRLGGHTGDTYGAVVEWTEALFLCAMTGFL